VLAVVDLLHQFMQAPAVTRKQQLNTELSNARQLAGQGKSASVSEGDAGCCDSEDELSAWSHVYQDKRHAELHL
jgi:hypothetical protein